MQDINSTSNPVNMKETIELLTQSEKEINFNQMNKNITLVFGNLGDNKKGFLKWLISDDQSHTIMEPKNNISTINESENLLPQLILNPYMNTAFYDCPDFYDDRSASHNVAATYFIKKAFDHADYVKFILIVSDITNENCIKDDDNFPTLVKHITDLIEIKNFPDSIAVIVTGVDNLNDEGLISDENIIHDIVKHLSAYKKSIEEKTSQDITKQLREFYEKAITLIDTLTEEKDGKYPRIGIVGKTNVNLPNNKILNKEKENIKEIIDNNLKFAKNTHDSFHYKFSKESKEHEYILNLEKQIENSLNIVFNNIEREIKKYFENSKKMMRNKMELFSTSKQSIDEVNIRQAQQCYASFIKGEQAISQLKDLNQQITWIQLSDKIKDISNTIKSEPLLQYTYMFNIQTSYLEFLKTTSDRIWNRVLLENSFNDIITYVKESKQNIQIYINNAEDKLTNNIRSNFEDITREIHNQVQERVRKFHNEQATNELDNVQNILKNITQELQDPQQLQGSRRKIISNIDRLIIDNSRIQTEISNAIDQLMCLTHLKYIDGSNQRNIPSSILIEPYEKTVQNLDYLKTWYLFLSDLQANFLEKVNKTHLSKFYANNIGNINPNIPKTIEITLNNIVSFLQETEKYNVTKLKNYDFSKLEKYQFEELNKLLNSAIPGTAKPFSMIDYCESVIKEENIKISDIRTRGPKLQCKNRDEINSLIIMATNTITIDKDFQAEGQNVIMIAPKWDIKGKRKIVLDGAPAPVLASTNSNNMGQDGKPGLPGGPAGNFFGIGLEFINGDSLTITANGGNGGTGQDGENGVPGRNGKAAILPLGRMSNNNALEEEFLDAINKYGYYEGTVSFNKFVYGTKGENGGKGGDGGKGGKGGYEGNITIFELGESSGIKIFMRKGIAGKGGKGGNGGIGGRNGDLTKVSYHPGFKAKFKGYSPSIHKGVDGTHGKNGFNDNGIEEPKKPLPLPNIKLIINEYKNDLNSLLNNKRSHLENNLQTKFYNQLSNLPTDNNFQNFFDAKSRNLESNLFKNQAIYGDRKKRSIEQQEFPNHDSAFWTTERVEYSIPNRISYHEYNTNINNPSNTTSLLNSFISTFIIYRMVAMKNGKNKTLRSNSFQFPEEKRNAEIEHLASQVRPILGRDEYVSRENEDDNTDSGTSLHNYGRAFLRCIQTYCRSLVPNMFGTLIEEKK